MGEMTEYQYATIERNGDQWVTSYDVWAKLNSYPTEEGDGIFVGNITIPPEDDTVAIALARPSAEDWYFAALSIYRRERGLFFQLNGT
jgi:hypothetical protein